MTNPEDVPEGKPAGGWWPERVAALISVILLSVPHFGSESFRTVEVVGSDFKTLYASAFLMARGQDAYDPAGIAQVFLANHVVLPVHWYSHAPVYPPFTLGLMAPMTALSMASAYVLWTLFSMLLITLAIASLARLGGKSFSLSRGWRMLLIVLSALFPLVLWSMLLGNVSAATSALCLLAIMPVPNKRGQWWQSAGLALALLLKPHLALWVMIAMLFGVQARRIAARAIAFCCVFVAASTAWLVTTGTAALQLVGYRKILQLEMLSGSMGPHARDSLPTGIQITSLNSLFGYLSAPAWQTFANIILGVLVCVLLYLSVRHARNMARPSPPLIAAWSAFGLIASYHRAHDGIVLLILLPIILGRLRISGADVVAWLLLVLMAALSLSIHPPGLQQIETVPAMHAISTFLFYRRSAFAALLLTVTLIIQLGATPPGARLARE